MIRRCELTEGDQALVDGGLDDADNTGVDTCGHRGDHGARQTPAHGDDLWLTHEVTASLTDAAGVPWSSSTVAEAAQLDHATMTDGAPLTITATFAPVATAPHPLQLTVNLAAVRAAFEAGHGHVAIQSEPGKGTTFALRIEAPVESPPAR